MPLYETPEDRQRAKAIAEAYAQTKQLEARMIEGLVPWNAEFYREGRLVSLAEVKVRRCKRLRFTTFKLDYAKVAKLLTAAKQRHVACGLLVEFLDGRFKVALSDVWLAEHATVSEIERKIGPANDQIARGSGQIYCGNRWNELAFR